MSVNCSFFPVIVFSQFMVNLQLSGSQILGAWSVKLKFSLLIIFLLTKPENRASKSLIWSNGTVEQHNAVQGNSTV